MTNENPELANRKLLLEVQKLALDNIRTKLFIAGMIGTAALAAATFMGVKSIGDLTGQVDEQTRQLDQQQLALEDQAGELEERQARLALEGRRIVENARIIEDGEKSIPVYKNDAWGVYVDCREENGTRDDCSRAAWATNPGPTLPSLRE